MFMCSKWLRICGIILSKSLCQLNMEDKEVILRIVSRFLEQVLWFGGRNNEFSNSTSERPIEIQVMSCWQLDT